MMGPPAIGEGAHGAVVDRGGRRLAWPVASVRSGLVAKGHDDPPWVFNASKRILEVDFIRGVALATAPRITNVLFSRG